DGVRREVRGAQIHLVRPEILAVGQEYVDADRRGMAGEDIRNLQEDGDAARAVVRAQDRLVAAARVGILVRHGPRVPVGDEEDAVGQLGAETGEGVGHAHDAAAPRLVVERLEDDGVGTLAEVRLHPGELLFVPGRAGHAWSEGDLPLEEGVGGVAIEVGHLDAGGARDGRAPTFARGGGDGGGDREDGRGPLHGRPPPAKLPAAKLNSPNSTSWNWLEPLRMPT